MGKIRIKTLGDEKAEKKQKEEVQKRKEAKETEQTPSLKAEDSKIKGSLSKAKKSGKVSKKKRSPKYLSGKKLVEHKPYSLNEALKLLAQLKPAKFDESVELHINTIEKGISGNIVLPHGTGKKTKVAIADDNIIGQIEKGKIEFDVLLAAPDMMPKLAKVARILGPRGLMPNPKNGTITKNPQETAKKYEGGQISFKTESKFPIIHLTVGKKSFDKEKLTANIRAVFGGINSLKIKNAVLKSTMSPSIKLDLSKI